MPTFCFARKEMFNRVTVSFPQRNAETVNIRTAVHQFLWNHLIFLGPGLTATPTWPVPPCLPNLLPLCSIPAPPHCVLFPKGFSTPKYFQFQPPAKDKILNRKDSYTSFKMAVPTLKKGDSLAVMDFSLGPIF